MKNLFRSLAVIVSLMFAHCNDPEEKDSDPTGGDEITVEDRMDALDRCVDKANELNNLVSLQDRIQMLTWLNTQPEFEMAGFAGEQLFAVFKDDRVLFFLDTPLDETGGRVAINGRDSVAPTTRFKAPVKARTEDVPGAKQTSLFMGLGRRYPNQPGAVDFIFSKSESGYVTKQRVASVDELKTGVSGDGIFYIFTHGGVGYVPSLRRPGAESPLMTLWTTTPVTPELDTLYKEDLKNRVLAYSIAPHDSRTSVKHYSITDGFVEKYMKFGPNCFIYLEACNGFSGLPGADALRQKFINKASNGKATIVGWTDTTPVDAAEKASIFLFDRLLASNTEGIGHIQVPKENPKQRPFDLEQVFRDMYSNNIGTAANGSKLVYQTNVQDDVLLRPTIEGLEIDEYTSTLSIKGRFPIEQGKVSVEGVIVNITSWSPYEISCIIPETGDGSVGNVVVSSAQEIKSNAVPLTEYILKLNFTADDNGVKLAGVCNLRIRVDIHKRRLKIHEEPIKPIHPDLSPVTGTVFNMKGSHVAYTITGHKYQTCHIDDCRMQVTESPRPVAARLDFTTSGTDSQFFGFYNWSDEMTKIKLNLLSIAPPLTGIVTEERVTCPDKPDVVSTVEIGYKGSMFFPVAKVTDYPIFKVAENYNILPGSYDQKVDRQWGFCINEVGKYQLNVTWDVVEPRFAPDQNTMSRMTDSDD